MNKLSDLNQVTRFRTWVIYFHPAFVEPLPALVQPISVLAYYKQNVQINIYDYLIICVVPM